ncbi:MAG: insulinase family protein [Puniceicoccales bacterium]|jgi:zinc protease|nr:insulinase family protein [Puniceicoccales bacterium]
MDALKFEWTSDIPIDGDVIAGKLSNGLHYFILPHGEPPERVSLRLIVGAGSLMEREGQRGLAHFLEHIAFCGSENFSRGDLIEYLQRMGMRFGHHSNASTGFSETVYKLELPSGGRQVLKDGLLVFRDYLTALEIDNSEIARERGVILSELRHIDSPQYRDAVERYRFLFPNAILGERFPIGDRSVIEEVDAAAMREFYETFYSPSNAALVIVGAVDPGAVIRVLQLVFGDVSDRITPANYAIGTFEIAGTKVKVHRESELPQARINICCVQMLRDYTDSKANREELLLHQVANRALTRRLEILSKEENAPFFQGEADSNLILRGTALIAGTQLTCDPQRANDALRTAEQELRRVIEFGFTEEEISRARQEISTLYKNARTQAKSIRSDRLIDDWVADICAGAVPTSVEWDDDFAQKILEATTAQRAWESFQHLWSPKNRLVYISGNISSKFTEAVARSTYLRSQRMPLRAPTSEQRPAFAYADFGPTGTISQCDVDGGLQLRRSIFSNGVRLNVRRTDFEAKQVLVRIRFGHGLLSEPANRPGLAKFAEWAFVEGGLRKHSWEELKNLLAGHVLRVNFSAGTGAFFLSGKTTEEDLRLQLQLLAAYLCDAGFRPEGDREAQKSILQVYAELEHTADGALADGGERFLHSGDRRFGYPEQAAMDTYTMDDLRRWLEPQLRDGYVEISVVGDVDPAEVQKLVAETFGTLPDRSGKPIDLDTSVALPSGQNANLTYETTIPKGLVQLCWPTDDRWNISQKRRLDLLADIFDERLRVRVRKEMGDTYSPYAHHVSSAVLKHYGYILAGALVDADRVNDVAHAAREISRELRRGEFTEDEFLRVKMPALNQVREQLRKNSYWLNGIDGCQAYPQELDFLRTVLSFYENVRREDLDSILKFLDDEKCITIKVRPTEL